MDNRVKLIIAGIVAFALVVGGVVFAVSASNNSDPEESGPVISGTAAPKPTAEAENPEAINPGDQYGVPVEGVHDHDNAAPNGEVCLSAAGNAAEAFITYDHSESAADRQSRLSQYFVDGAPGIDLIPEAAGEEYFNYIGFDAKVRATEVQAPALSGVYDGICRVYVFVTFRAEIKSELSSYNLDDRIYFDIEVDPKSPDKVLSLYPEKAIDLGF